MSDFLNAFFNLQIMADVAPMVLRGLWLTLLLAIMVIPMGIVGGFLVAMAYVVAPRPLRVVIIVLIDLFRSIPPLVLLVFVFYGLPFLGIVLPSLFAVACAMTLNTSSYYGEIFRNGFTHIPRGQIEAARSTGMTKAQSLVWIATPQVVRNVFPDLVGNSIEVVKATSIASVVALPELLRMARIAQGNTYNATPLIMAAAIYLIILLPIVRYMLRFERKDMGAH